MQDSEIIRARTERLMKAKLAALQASQIALNQEMSKLEGEGERLEREKIKLDEFKEELRKEQELFRLEVQNHSTLSSTERAADVAEPLEQPGFANRFRDSAMEVVDVFTLAASMTF